MHYVAPEVRKLMVKDIIRIFEVSRKTVWKWARRAKYLGRESFKDLPKTLHKVKRKIDVYYPNV
ncbi:MAG: hypothetical protein DRM98_03285 [Thermoplasmata archaeon]|nr:MAG: hypothetical protein DRM98_03285 [Thermoplasmata archaeon]RLF51357.1 MAG: hypothetical protein DRN24_05135 [Thermoplasmata archaeon]